MINAGAGGFTCLRRHTRMNREVFWETRTWLFFAAPDGIGLDKAGLIIAERVGSP
jgi:hypothetical protein